MGSLIEKIKNFLFSKNMELAIIGLENCGKTTFTNQLSFGEPKKTFPTIGFNVRNFQKKSILKRFKTKSVGS